MICRNRPAPRRSAAAAAEAAILLSTLVLLAFIAFDYCRVFQYAEVVNTCAQAGALYMIDPSIQSQSPYYVSGDMNKSVSNAALASWPSNLGSPPTVSLNYNSGGSYPNFAQVTVSYTFQPVVSYLIIPATVTVTRTVEVQVMPLFPNGIQ
jgi:hypothetical protein